MISKTDLLQNLELFLQSYASKVAAQNGRYPVVEKFDASNQDISSSNLNFGFDLAYIIFDDCNISNSKLDRTNIIESQFQRTNLYHSYFIKSKIFDSDFTGASFQRAQLPRTEVNSSLVQLANFAESNCLKTQFNHSDMSNTSFDRANLWKTSFSNCRLTQASFRFSNLAMTKFSGSDISSADFTGARITPSVLQGAVGVDSIKADWMISVHEDGTESILDGIVLWRWIRKEGIKPWLSSTIPS